MKITPLAIPDVLLIEPKIYFDERGFFYESFNQREFSRATGINVSFVQDNHSKSKKNIIRGLHYQINPKAQGKLVRVVHGKIFDVAVDIRKNSNTFGQWVGIELSAENKHQLWIPPGFAHGFLTLSETAECLYKTTDYYSAEHERIISWNDSDLNINWPLQNAPVLSKKDLEIKKFMHAEVF